MVRSPLFPILGTLALAGALASCGQTEPFLGTHQAGVATPPQKFAFVAAFDVTAADADGVRTLLQTWTRQAEALTAGRGLAEPGSTSVPPGDTGEVLGEGPSRLTLTFGIGPSMFDGRYGLADRRPAGLVPLPAFPGDALRPEASDGDLVVQAAADSYAVAYHALHTLTRSAQGLARVRWVVDGFSGPRNLQGFLDGTVNPDVKDPAVMDQQVWTGADTGWLEGGTYLVYRKIRMFVEIWDRSSLGDQEKTIGRARSDGKELEASEADSHRLAARGDGTQKILRRPFSYVAGLDPRTGQWDSGLLFLAWMQDPGRQFVPIQTRLSANDRLNEYIQVQGSAVFAAFPGVKPGSYLGAGLFPEPPLEPAIEGLQAAIGAVYPAIGRGDWAAVRTGAAAWKAQWTNLRLRAGDRAPNIDRLADAWALSLDGDAPDPRAVKAAQADLVKALSAWEASTAPRASATDLSPLTSSLDALTRALAAGQSASARDAYTAFQRAWTSKEALVRQQDGGAYAKIETGLGDLRRALFAEPPAAETAAKAQDLRAVVASVKAPSSFGAWDAGFLLFREGLEALLVLAALLTFLAKTGQTARVPWVWAGAGVGLAASVAAAAAISVLMTGWAAASAPGLIEGLTGLAAVVLMLTVGAWLHGKASVKNWNTWLKGQMGKVGNSRLALAALAFTAILREGAETVVFFWGLAGSLATADLLWGVAGALVVLALLGVLMIGFSKRLPLQWFFPLATGLIYFLAVKILGQALGSLQAVGWVPSHPLGFGGEVEFLGFSPTWETALAQVLLAAVLAVLLGRSVAAHGPAKKPA